VLHEPVHGAISWLQRAKHIEYEEKYRISLEAGKTITQK